MYFSLHPLYLLHSVLLTALRWRFFLRSDSKLHQIYSLSKVTSSGSHCFLVSSVALQPLYSLPRGLLTHWGRLYATSTVLLSTPPGHTTSTSRLSRPRPLPSQPQASPKGLPLWGRKNPSYGGIWVLHPNAHTHTHTQNNNKNQRRQEQPKALVGFPWDSRTRLTRCTLWHQIDIFFFLSPSVVLFPRHVTGGVKNRKNKSTGNKLWREKCQFGGGTSVYWINYWLHPPYWHCVDPFYFLHFFRGFLFLRLITFPQTHQPFVSTYCCYIINNGFLTQVTKVRSWIFYLLWLTVMIYELPTRIRP